MEKLQNLKSWKKTTNDYFKNTMFVDREIYYNSKLLSNWSVDSVQLLKKSKQAFFFFFLEIWQADFKMLWESKSSK